MAKCYCCEKEVKFGNKISHSHRRSNRAWKPNLMRVKIVENGFMSALVACVPERSSALSDQTSFLPIKYSYSGIV